MGGTHSPEEAKRVGGDVSAVVSDVGGQGARVQMPVPVADASGRRARASNTRRPNCTDDVEKVLRRPFVESFEATFRLARFVGETCRKLFFECESIYLPSGSAPTARRLTPCHCASSLAGPTLRVRSPLTAGYYYHGALVTMSC